MDATAISTADHWQIQVKDLRTSVRIGAYTSEQSAPQEVVVSITLTVPAPARHTSEDLADVVDYDHLARYVTEDWPQRPHTNLLETLAEDLMAKCLSDPRVASATVGLIKTGMYPNSNGVGVQLTRTRG